MIKIMLLSALLPGCAMYPGSFVEINGNIQHRTGASDWVMVDGGGASRDYIGQVQAIAGIERGGWSAYAGFNHLSLPEYGHDRGYNGQVIGISKRITF